MISKIRAENRELLSYFFLFLILHFRTNSSALLQLLQNMEQVLATNDQFLLGRWLESAKALGKQESDKKLFEFNARNQITLWGPKANVR